MTGYFRNSQGVSGCRIWRIRLTLLLAALLFPFFLKAQSETHFSKLYDYHHEWEGFGNTLQNQDGSYFILGTSANIFASDSTWYKKWWILHLDKEGRVLKQSIIGKNHIHYYIGSYALLRDSRDNFVAVGSTEDTARMSKGLLIWLDTSLSVVKLLEYDTDSSSTTVLYSIKQLHDKGFIASGYRNGNMYMLRLDSAGGVIWDKEYKVNGLSWANYADMTPDSGFILSGSAKSGDEFTLIKADKLGKLQWQKEWRQTNRENGGLAKTLSNGNILFVGSSTYSSTKSLGYIAELSLSGAILWRKLYDQYDYLDLGDALELPDKTYVLPGVKDQGNTGYLLKIDSTGNIIWERQYRYSAISSNYTFEVSRTQDGGFLLSGFTRDTLPGGKPRPDQDAWLIKVDSLGYSHSVDYVSINDIYYYKQNILGKAYPNPAMGTVSIPYTLPEGCMHACIALYDITGRLIIQKPTPEKEGNIMLDVGGLSSGIYLYRLEMDNGYVLSNKLIVE